MGTVAWPRRVCPGFAASATPPLRPALERLRDRVHAGPIIEQMNIGLQRERRRRVAKPPLHSTNVARSSRNDRPVRVTKDVEAYRRDSSSCASGIQDSSAVVLVEPHAP